MALRLKAKEGKGDILTVYSCHLLTLFTNMEENITELIGSFRFATATKSSTTTRFFLLNLCY